MSLEIDSGICSHRLNKNFSSKWAEDYPARQEYDGQREQLPGDCYKSNKEEDISTNIKLWIMAFKGIKEKEMGK